MTLHMKLPSCITQMYSPEELNVQYIINAWVERQKDVSIIQKRKILESLLHAAPLQFVRGTPSVWIAILLQ